MAITDNHSTPPHEKQSQKRNKTTLRRVPTTPQQRRFSPDQQTTPPPPPPPGPEPSNPGNAGFSDNVPIIISLVLGVIIATLFPIAFPSNNKDNNNANNKPDANNTTPSFPSPSMDKATIKLFLETAWWECATCRGLNRWDLTAPKFACKGCGGYGSEAADVCWTGEGG
jgi:hypothetical protein